MKEYDSSLEGRRTRTHQGQPNGVSESSSDMTHRSEMDKPGDASWKDRKSVSQRVNERQAGELATLHKKDHGAEGGKASNENDDKLVDEGKSLKEKYADRYGN